MILPAADYSQHACTREVDWLTKGGVREWLASAREYREVLPFGGAAAKAAKAGQTLN